MFFKSYAAVATNTNILLLITLQLKRFLEFDAKSECPHILKASLEYLPCVLLLIYNNSLITVVKQYYKTSSIKV
jgi:hypothetical protein